MDVKALVEKAIEDSFLTEQEFNEIQNSIKEDGQIDDVENEQIGRLMEMLKNGHLKVV